MEKSKEELIAEIEKLQQKCSALEAKYNEDINKYKKIEEELRLRLMFLEGIANSTFDGFLVVNPYGQKILQNQQTIKLWKIPQEIVDDPDGLKQVKHVMHMAVNPQQFVAEIDYLREHPDEKSRDELELVDGTVLDRYSSPVIGPDGKNYGRIWTFHDITERKNFEKQLIKLNEDKDHFISILAHDLRSPFNSLLGFAGLLKKNLRVYSIEKIEKKIDAIDIVARRTFDLLEETLLWANVQSKKTIYSPSIISIDTVICEVINILEPIAKLKNINIEYVDKKEMLLNIDIYMFKAILRNLISNAIKFTNENGCIKVFVVHNESDTIFKVSDNGIGIEPEHLERLFKLSYIQSKKGTANELGTGLGLILCKEFVDQHCGKIWIESTVNKGTIVSFSLPN